MGTGEWRLEAGDWGIGIRERIADSRDWGVGNGDWGMEAGDSGVGDYGPSLRFPIAYEQTAFCRY